MKASPSGTTGRRQRAAGARIPRQVVSSVEPAGLTPRRVAAELRRQLAGGARLRVVGAARERPEQLLRRYPPRFRIDLFDLRFYLAGLRQNQDIRFYVAYLARDRDVYVRLFYKDVSLVWRAASHLLRSEQENWIGKGDVKAERIDGEECLVSDEATTDLPLEMQTALESLIARSGRIPTDDVAPELVLRRGPDSRLQPYVDFTAPRRRAQANPVNLVNGGRPVARFTRAHDPTSLRITPGYEPDFRHGIAENSSTRSRLYGGRVLRYRILSTNRHIQYGFFAGPRHVWIGSVQATTTELSSFGVRTIDVPVDEQLLLPGYEYHFMDEDCEPPELVSQIPKGHAGETSGIDASRADASPWLDRVPVIQRFRREVLAGRRPRPGT